MLAAKDTEAARQRQNELRQQLEQLAAEHARSSAAYTHEQEQLNKLLGKQAQLRRRLQRTRQELAQTNAEISALNEEQAQLQQQRSQTIARLREVSSLFQVARQAMDPAADSLEQARQKAWLQHLGRNRAALLDQLKGEAEQLNTLERKLRQTLDRQQAQTLEQNAQLKDMDGLAAEHSSMIAELERQLARDADQERALQKQLAAVDALVQRLEQAQTWAGKQPKGLAPLRGKLKFPVVGSVRQAFGARTGSGQRSRGVLVDINGGQPIQAIAPGVVVWVGWLSRLGLTMIVDHGADYYSIYAHAQQALFGVGDSIRTGDALILSGQTGGLSRPGLYLEIRRGRRALNPNTWFKNSPRS